MNDKEKNLDKNQKNKKNKLSEKNQKLRADEKNKLSKNLDEHNKKNEVETQEDENLKKYEIEISNLKDEKLRILADMENLRKRAEREKLDAIKYGNTSLAKEVLSPIDNLDRAIENFPKNEKNSEKINNFIEGLKMVQKEFISLLEKNGIKKINDLNEKFDHNFHQAMLEVESDEDEGVVVQEIKSGYTMHDRLLRPSLVAVSKKSKK